MKITLKKMSTHSGCVHANQWMVKFIWMHGDATMYSEEIEYYDNQHDIEYALLNAWFVMKVNAQWYSDLLKAYKENDMPYCEKYDELETSFEIVWDATTDNQMLASLDEVIVYYLDKNCDEELYTWSVEE